MPLSHRGKVLIPLLIMAGAWDHSLAESRDQPTLSVRDAAKLLRDPKGSLSVGSTGAGELRNAIVMEHSGPGWRLLSKIPGRATNHGTEEMVNLVSRVGKRVATEHPGSVIGVGNISLVNGGRSRWHVSHQAGRDVDLLFFATRDDRPVNPRRFLHYDETGVTGPKTGLTFDVPRNLTLVLALVEQDEAPVQWIFVADYLKTMLLEAAKDKGVDEPTMGRLERVLHQPSDALPHADHFHVRLFCSLEDRLHGCLDGAPFWDWVDRGDEAYGTRVREVSRLLQMKHAAWRVKGAEYLATLRASKAVPQLVAGLRDPNRGVRQACLNTLKTIGDGAAIEGVLDVLKDADDARWARALFGSLRRLRGERTEKVAMAFLESPTSFLHPDVSDRGEKKLAPFRVVAARLLGRKGDLDGVPYLLALLADGDGDVRQAAEEGLVGTTNHVVKPAVASRSKRKRARGLKAWRALAAGWEGRDWLDVVMDGFAREGVRFTRPLTTSEAVRELIEVTGEGRSHLRQNASLVLSSVTGHRVSPYSRGSRRLKRHWNRWWETDGAEWLSSLEPSPEPTRSEKPQGERGSGRSEIQHNEAGTTHDEDTSSAPGSDPPTPGSGPEVHQP